MFIYLMFLIHMYSMELHSIELHLINFCLSITIKLNTNIILFKMPMKINKNAANAYICYEKYDK